MARTATGDVKIIAFGAAGVSPTSEQSYVVRKQGTGLVCEQTPPGLLFQTPSGKKGTITVNGVQIKLGSTAFVALEGDLLFDQDPRIGRRQGKANPNAPLCSGFDSDCDFGDRSCELKSRVVWGPYCGENRYDYIRPGLYRVSLYGKGQVRAGATDYELTRKQFSLSQKDFTLSPTQPSTYTFCWAGQQSGSNGWEAVVTAQNQGVRVDRVTVEFLGDNCATAGKAGTGAGVMTVTSMEGDVVVTALGKEMRPAPGEKVRVGMDGTKPVWIDDPRQATAIYGSPVLQWLTFDPGGLPEVNTGSEASPDQPPVVQFTQIGLDPYSEVESTGLVGEVYAYDPDVGQENGDGIANVLFRVYDPYGTIVHERTEGTAAYCMFGGNGPCTPFVFAQQQNTWDSGYAIQGGAYVLQATAVGKDGSSTVAEQSINLQPSEADSQGPDIANVTTDPAIDGDVFNTCPYNDFTVSSQITDPSGVASATFYYRLTTFDTTSDWFAVNMDADDDFYYAALTGIDGDSIEFVVGAVDTLGNESYSDGRYATIALCDG